MGGLWNCWSGFVLFFALVACQSTQRTLDLRDSEELYRPTRYQARAPADRAVFVTPLADQRSPEPVPIKGPYPVAFMAESYWARPLVEMIGDVLVEELESSAVFSEVQRTSPPADDALILKPYLVEARCGQEERVNGRRGIALVGLKIVVYGPVQPDGERSMLLEETVHQPVTSQVSMRPPTSPQMMGLALTGAMRATLRKIDESNVARSGVPREPRSDAQSDR